MTTRYSDQQGSKSRQNIMLRPYKQWHRPMSKRFIKPPYSISRAASIDSGCCRLPTTSFLSDKADRLRSNQSDSKLLAVVCTQRLVVRISCRCSQVGVTWQGFCRHLYIPIGWSSGCHHNVTRRPSYLFVAISDSQPTTYSTGLAKNKAKNTQIQTRVSG